MAKEQALRRGLRPGFLQGDLADAIAADVGLALYPPGAPDWFSPLAVLAYRAQGPGRHPNG